MRLGVYIFPTDTTIQPAELAREVEARGFDSLWFPEHSHIPASRRTPWGGRQGAPPLPEEYWRTHDQFVALGAAAAVTTKIKLATGITLVAQRDPFWLAKEVASLDMISGGRFIFGIGYGWNIEEMEHHGVADQPASGRGAGEGAGGEGAVGQRRGVLQRHLRQLRAVVGLAEAGADSRTRRSSSGRRPPR